MGLDTAGVIVAILLGVWVLVRLGVWGLVQRRMHQRRNATPDPLVDELTMQLLKGMREQIKGTNGYTVYGGPVADRLGMKLGSQELDRRLHGLLQAGYLEVSANPYLSKAHYWYLITSDGIDAADAYQPRSGHGLGL